MKSIEHLGNSNESEATNESKFRRLGKRLLAITGISASIFLGSQITANAEELRIDTLNPGSAMQIENFLPPELTTAINTTLDTLPSEQQAAIGDVVDTVEDTVYTFAPEIIPADITACDNPGESTRADMQCAAGLSQEFYQEAQGEEFNPVTVIIPPKLGVHLSINPENPTDFCGYAPILMPGEYACDDTIFLSNPELVEPRTAEEYKTIVAHEWNHTVQEGEGHNVSGATFESIMSGDMLSNSAPFANEQRSDCAAGAEAAWRESKGLATQEDILVGEQLVGDLSGGPEDKNHGTEEERKAAYKEGLEEGIGACVTK